VGSAKSDDMQLFEGIAASSGIAVGRLRVIDRRRLSVDEYSVGLEDVQSEIQRLQSAIERTREELDSLRSRLALHTGAENLIFIDTHIMIMSDDRLLTESSAFIESGLINAEGALRRALHKYREVFDAMEDSYLRERILDIETVVEKILRNLTGTAHPPISQAEGHTIIAAHDLTPGDILQMDRSRIIGIATEVGGKTTHASILARAFEIPAVAGIENIADMGLDGKPAILDGIRGRIIINPDREAFREYLHRKQHYEYIELELLKNAALPAETLDGHRLAIKGNVEVPEEGATVLKHGGEGVGLYRTEMLFMNRKFMPGEDEQYYAYRAMQEAVAPRSLTIRTLDAGGDKLLDGINHGAEQNPALGMRAIRLALSMPDEFKKQLRAILRVSASGPVKIMFPMISGVEELDRVLALLDEAKAELHAEQIPFDRAVQTGIMIEIPSAVVIADLLAPKVNFFSVGTNDLIQYSLAIDRSNEHLAGMYQPLHPAVLRSLRSVVAAAHDAGIEACICGEMAGDPLYLPILLGLGFDELSMNVTSIPRVKHILRRCTFARAVEITRECFAFDTASHVEAHLKSLVTRYFAESFD